ncbi:MAG TPA: polysaccharide biosynthesis tyrosine autokinase [Kofleriaceae bacterium]
MDDRSDKLPVDADEELLNFDARRYLDGLKKYVWVVLAIEALAITLAVIYTHRQPNVYQATASVQIEPRLPDLLGDRADSLPRANVGGIDYYMQQKEVLGSYTLVKQSVTDHRLYTKLLPDSTRAMMKLDDQIELATRLARGMLTIKYPDDNRIMYVVVQNTDPDLAAEIANDQVSTYVVYSKGLLSTNTKEASGALATEFDDAEAKLREAESALFQYQKDNDLLAVTIEDRQNMVSSGITLYTNKLNEAHAKRLELSAKLDRMRKAANDDVLSSPILVIGENTSFDALRAEYYSERNKFIELEKEIGPKNTAYQMQKAKLDDLYSALQSEAKRMLAGLEEQVQAVAATESAFKAEVDRATQESLALGPKVVAYDELTRKKKSAEDRYNILRTKLSTSEMSYRMDRNFDSSNVRPLDPALVPRSPVSPSLRKNVAAAGVLALLVAFGLVFLIVFLDRSIKTTADAQQATGAPVLGVIPLLHESQLDGDESGRDLYVHKQPTSSVAECCRSLRTNILFSSADRQLKTIVVSSANPREGKTTSVIYLGTTMAQSGQRVLLVDTDMRRPRLHVPMGASRQTGLSNLIVGEKDYDEVIKTTEIPNLWVLPCGPLPPNPAELLMSQRFSVVLGELAKRFDRVILDSPPLQLVTDAVVLSKQADGVIMVVHADKTLREDSRRAARQLRHVGGTIFGTVVNAIDDSRSTYYYGKYGAYYSYSEKSPEPQV